MARRVAASLSLLFVAIPAPLAIAGGPNLIFDFNASYIWNSGFYRDWTNQANNQSFELNPPVTGNVSARLEGVSTPISYDSNGYNGVYVSSGNYTGDGSAFADAPAPIGSWNTGVFEVSTEVWIQQPINERVLRVRAQYNGWINQPETAAAIQSDLWVRGVDEQTYNQFHAYVIGQRPDLFINAFNTLTPNYRSLITAHDTYLPGPVPGITRYFYGTATSMSAVLVPAPGAALALVFGAAVTTRRRR